MSLAALSERAPGECRSVPDEDAACLQIGIGGMPNAVYSLLRRVNLRDRDRVDIAYPDYR